MDIELFKKELSSLAKNDIKGFNEYQSNDGVNVPRVTEVLSAMLHEDFLMKWSNSLGFKRISYDRFMRAAADKGTYSHYVIEQFLKYGKTIKDCDIPDIYIDTVRSTFSGFRYWWKDLNDNHDVELVFSEEKLISNYFGGTCDCVLKVDGEYWLIDFKTSNHMNFKYCLQLAAYRDLLKTLRGIEISKTVVLLLDKTDGCYREYVLDLKDPTHLAYIDDCTNLFYGLVYGYVERLRLLSAYKEIF